MSLRVIGIRCGEIEVEGELNICQILDDMPDKDRLEMMERLMCGGGQGFTTKAREMVNHPKFDE